MTALHNFVFLRKAVRRAVLCAVLILVSIVLFAHAATSDDIVFPIVELGSCESKDACIAYCDLLDHKEACLSFAEQHQLISPDEIEKARRVPAEDGPGGCTSADACHVYCEAEDHHEECLAFAEKHDLIDRGEAVRVRRAEEIDSGGRPGPGGCRGDACKDYCHDKEHFDECLDFGVKNGFIKDKEAEIARKIAREGGPGGCANENECRAYCEDPSRIEECVAFGKKHGVISEEEATRATILAKGGPGGCKSEGECRAFCEDAKNQETCLAFAEEHDLIPPEELARAKKFLGKPGPGGCTGGACKEYCEDPAHQEECLDFAEREGVMPKEEVLRARKFMKAAETGGPGGCVGRACKEYCRAASHREECFDFAKKNDLLSEDDMRMMEVDRKLNAKLEESGGPGGCKSEEECKVYCADPTHVEECIAFASAHGGVSAEKARDMLEDFIRGSDRGSHGPDDLKNIAEDHFKRFEVMRDMEKKFRGAPDGDTPGLFGSTGPGGCAGPDECIAFCSDAKNRDECGSFRPPAGEGGRGGDKGMGGAGRHEFPGAGQPGSWGCEGDECETYCDDENNREECARFRPSVGGVQESRPPAGMSLPDECKTIAGCKTYCEEHGGEPGVAEQCRGIVGGMQNIMLEGASGAGIRFEHQQFPFTGERVPQAPGAGIPRTGGDEGTFHGELPIPPEGSLSRPEDMMHPEYQQYTEPVPALPLPEGEPSLVAPSPDGGVLRGPAGIFGLLLWPLLQLLGE
ncbi:MAG: hypothetical protein A3I44_05115 [Candidatus Sungbacteria bacterium RIFCSPLOWO2_02_FULL_51_17]|nr:MAG: hypothetical protein A3I44_05115 [Candidatus Sungbacteria bacterium RIFCSPLOWO2_02_FULL_51_17]